MSFSLVTPYFEGKMESLGWTLWPEPFNFENIPSDLLDHSFQIETGDIVGEGQNMTVLETRTDVVIRAFRKGFTSPKDVKEELIDEVQKMLCSILSHGSRLTAGIKNVEFQSMALTPLNLDNDNAMIATLTFRARVLLNIGV